MAKEESVIMLEELDQMDIASSKESSIRGSPSEIFPSLIERSCQLKNISVYILKCDLFLIIPFGQKKSKQLD